jgi:gliding motility-associated-like protein
LKKITNILSFLFLTLILSVAQNSYATHLIGGYMSYRYVGPLPNGQIRYLVTLNIYRDCKQSEVDFDDKIQIGVYFNNLNRDRYTTAIFKILKRQKVEPPGSIDCDFYNQRVCIEEGFYQGTIDVPPSPVGYLLSYVRCCRNNQDNLPSGSEGLPFLGQTYYCQIPPTSIQNSSPFFSGVPSPYMCARDTTNILNSAVDLDGDSLVYYIAFPYQGGSLSQSGAEPTPPNNLKLPIETVVYKPGYDYNLPFGTGGMSDVNPNNGLTSLFSPKTGSFVVAIEVAEYRNGILLSRVRLDMQILVLDCPPNNRPKISNSTTSYEVEAGAQICFDIEATDQDDDFITITGKGDIFSGTNGYAGPKATLTKDFAKGNVKSKFCWQTTCDLASVKPYLFTAEVWDDGCPPKFDNKNFSITIKPFKGADGIVGPNPVCNFSSGNVYTAQNTSLKSSFEWTIEGGIILGVKDRASITVRWNVDGIGKLTMTEISQYGCRGQLVARNITILPSPPLPIITGKDTICLGVIGEPYSVKANLGSTYNWNLTNGSLTPNSNTAKIDWFSKGQGVVWVVEISSNGCPSDTAKMFVNIRKPSPTISGNYSICPNAKGIDYKANTLEWGSKFEWTITGGTQASGGNSANITVDWGNQGVGKIVLEETDRFGCISDLNASFMDIIKDYVLQGNAPQGRFSVCEFDQGVPYQVPKTNNSIYYWDISGGIQASGDSTHSITANWGATGNGRVGVQENAYDNVNMKACKSVSKYLDVIINPLPTADQIEGPMDLCQTNDTTYYIVNGFIGSSYRWEINNIVQTEKSNTLKIVWNLPGTFKISVFETTKDTCPGLWIDTIVYVRPKPTTTGIFGLITACEPNITGFAYSVKGFLNSTYNWDVTNGTIISGLGTDSIVVDWQKSQTGNVRFNEVSEYNCLGDTLDLPIYINDLKVELLVVSVGFPDDRMLVDWTIGADKLIDNDFDINRRNAATAAPWNTIVNTNPAVMNYLDKPLNTDEFPYEYQIAVKDVCGNTKLSEPHTNVWLSGIQSTEDLSLLLKFTPYLGWKNGADRYELYNKSNRIGEFKSIENVTPGTQIVFPNDSKNFQECFRIKTYELNGNQKVSWSNEICFYFSPNVFVPNAFTPNGDNLNESFNVVPVAVNKFEMEVYNRWGERMYRTIDPTKGWDGNYLNLPAQAGVYMYTLRFTDYENRPYYKSGTVHLMR